ncbi:hypothetical protein BDR07DRAFT_1384225 [Suillus spraguei]|nr:hypothetical protein BDR07DRAFT_1384225 [Suillus spraguei]
MLTILNRSFLSPHSLPLTFMPPSRTRQGLSRTVWIVNAGNRTHITECRIVSHATISKEGAAAQACYQLDIIGLADETINTLADMREESPALREDTKWIDSEDIGLDVEALPEHMKQ